MKKFLLKLFAYFLLFSLSIFAVNTLYIYRIYSKNFAPMSGHKKDDDFIISSSVPEKIMICNFGSSHGFYGFNYEDVEEKYTCCNFAMASQSLMYDYRLLENYAGNIRKGAAVFIVISHFSLFGHPETKSADFLSRNRRYYRLLPPELIKFYDRKTDFYVNCMPSLISDNIIKFLMTLFVPSEDSWDDDTNHRDALRHAKPRAKGFIEQGQDRRGVRIHNQESVNAVYRMIEICRNIGATPILVTTPYLNEYNNEVNLNYPAFHADFYGVIDEIVRNTGVKYYDYSSDERYTDNYGYFFNTDHLNRKGARLFTNNLLREALGIDVTAE